MLYHPGMHIRIQLGIILTCLPFAALADPPTIEAVSAHKSSSGWNFDVTLAHPDTGWDHYADGWRVLDQDGTELAMRVLHHPHVQEQPFTRSIGGVQVPEGVKVVQIEARCLVDGWSGERIAITLP